MAQPEVLVPDALHDPDNPRQPWASQAVKAQLVEFACREEYPADVMFGISAANQEAAQALTSVFLQAPEEEEHEDDPFAPCDECNAHVDPHERDERRRLKKATQAELSLCLKARIANQSILPFLTVTALSTLTGIVETAPDLKSLKASLQNPHIKKLIAPAKRPYESSNRLSLSPPPLTRQRSSTPPHRRPVGS